VTSVQIKNVPDETHAVLRARAAAAHQSLQEYLRTLLIEEASHPTLGEVLDRAGGRAGSSIPLEISTQAVRQERDRRWRQRTGHCPWRRCRWRWRGQGASTGRDTRCPPPHCRSAACPGPRTALRSGLHSL